MSEGPCAFCPIAALSSAAQGLRPETTEHFVRAGTELLAGMRGLVEALAELLRGVESRGTGAATIERIPVRRA